MDPKETVVLLKCDCGCSMFVVEKSEWDNGEVNYNITVQDSRYDHNYTTLWGRIKTAFKILFGKRVYYSDVYINEPEKFKAFVEKLNELCKPASLPTTSSLLKTAPPQT